MDPSSSTVNTQPTLLTRIKMWWDSVCLLTKISFVACIVIFIAQSLLQVPATETICYSFLYISQKFQLWRILTAPFFHASFLHIVFNMFALVSLGIMLERKIGTVNMLVSTVAIILCCGLFQFGLTYLASKLIPIIVDIGDEKSFLGRILRDMIFECGVGLSAVLFAYLVIAVHYEPMQNLFGLAVCPAYLYPWILLFVSSLLMVGVSFFGHLSGIFAGYVLVFLLMKRVVWLRMISWIESKLPTRLVQINSFVLSSQQQQQQQQQQQEQLGTSDQQEYVFSTSRAEGRTLGRTAPTLSSPREEQGGFASSASTTLSSWFRNMRESASNGYHRFTSLFTSSRNNNRREYDHLDEEDELPAPMHNNVDPRYVISNTREIDMEEQQVQQPLPPAQQNPPAPPQSTVEIQQSPVTQQEHTSNDNYFKSLPGSGKRLGDK